MVPSDSATRPERLTEISSVEAARHAFESKEGAAVWLKRTYADLRKLMLAGRLDAAQPILGRVSFVTEAFLPADKHQQYHLTNEWLIDGIRATINGDPLQGLESLNNVQGTAQPWQRWLASIWSARAAAERADFAQARAAATQAMKLSEQLDAHASSSSLSNLGEIELLAGADDIASAYLSSAAKVFEQIEDHHGQATALLALSRISFTNAKADDATEYAQRARAVRPDWDAPTLVLAQQLVTRGNYGDAKEVLEDHVAQHSSPIVERELRLVRLAQRQLIPPRAVNDYIRLRDASPTDSRLTQMAALVEENTDFLQARELLAWSLFRRGHDQEATEHFQILLSHNVDSRPTLEVAADPDIHASALLGLGCIANRQHTHIRPARRAFASTSLARRSLSREPDDETDYEDVAELLPLDDGEFSATHMRLLETKTDPSVDYVINEDDGSDAELLEGSSSAEEEFSEYVDSSVAGMALRGVATVEIMLRKGAQEESVSDTVRVPLGDIETAELALGDPPAPQPLQRTPTAEVAVEQPDEVTAAAPIAAQPTEQSIVSEFDDTRRAPIAEDRASIDLGEGSWTRIKTRTAAEKMFSGELDLFQVPDLLVFLGNAKRSGTLLVTSRQGIGAIHMRSGKLISAASPSVSTLGQMLVRRGVLDAEQLSESLDRARAGRRMLGELLVAEQIATREQVEDGLKEQMLDALAEMAEWTNGRFVFEVDAGSGIPQEDGSISLSLDPSQLLIALVGRGQDG